MYIKYILGCRISVFCAHLDFAIALLLFLFVVI